MDKSHKRIQKELTELNETSPYNIKIIPNENDFKQWKLLLSGPQNSIYQNGLFKILITFPDGYPFKAPNVKFETKIYHPNVKFDTGELCNLLYEKDWTPVKKISNIIDIIVNILCNPDTENPVEPEISILYSENREEFNKNVLKTLQHK